MCRCMAETSTNAFDRIDRALARIEAAARARRGETQALARRHAALRDEVGEAVQALDALLAQQPQSGEEPR